MTKRISIYIDGANFYGGITSINPKYTDTKFDFEKYIKQLTKENSLVNIYYYNGSLKRQINPDIFRKQQRLFSRLREIDKCKVIICKRKPRIDTEGNEYHVIKADDVHLTLDMLGDAYENKYDEAILISSDGDFIPLIERVKRLKKDVTLCYFENCTSKELIRTANKKIIIEKRTLKKFFFKK